MTIHFKNNYSHFFTLFYSLTFPFALASDTNFKNTLKEKQNHFTVVWQVEKYKKLKYKFNHSDQLFQYFNPLLERV